MQKMNWIDIGLFFIVFLLLFSLFHEANAGEPVMVAQFNDNVRIVLTNKPCPMLQGSRLAVAQRIDNQYMRGCYTYEPTNKLIRIQWSADRSDFAVLDADRFKKDEIK